MIINTPIYENLGAINLKLDGSFSIKTSPVEIQYPQKFYLVDRWGPVKDADKERTTFLLQTRLDWIEAGQDVWYGFEGEGMVYPEHLYEYYNVIVLRPNWITPRVALNIVEARMG